MYTSVFAAVGAAGEIANLSQMFQRSGLERRIPVGFQAEVSLHVPDGKEVADLRAEADGARLKTADVVSGPAVTADFLIAAAEDTDQSSFDSNCDASQSKGKSTPFW